MTAAATQPEMTTTALAQWYGSNRTLARTVGVQLGRLKWAGVPFCGGCCELPHIRARSGIASDLHRHIINMARVVREPVLKAELAARLDATLFHPDELSASQDRCRVREETYRVADSLFGGGRPAPQPDTPDVAWAFDYFVCCWMGRGGNAGTATEFRQSMSFRWNANGGDSCTRFRSAADSLDAWHQALRPWNFVTMDALAFLADCQDEEGHGIYPDAPWPGPGDKYAARFSERQQRDLAKELARFKKARVVIRFGDHPLIRELYPEDRWNWLRQTSRAQSNGDVPEVLILNGPSFGEGGR